MLEPAGIEVGVAEDREPPDCHLPPVSVAAPLPEAVRVPAFLAPGDLILAAAAIRADAGARKNGLIG
jgi:hypothetical protein